jgi:hypothetical protein
VPKANASATSIATDTPWKASITSEASRIANWARSEMIMIRRASVRSTTTPPNRVSTALCSTAQAVMSPTTAGGATWAAVNTSAT